MKPVKISEIWNDLTSSFKYDITYEGDTVTLVSAAEFKQYLKRYYDFNFLTITTTPLQELLEYWQEFNTRTAASYTRAWLALTEEYNPLHNYDKHSVITTETDEHEDTVKNPLVSQTDKIPLIKTENSGVISSQTDKAYPYDDNSTGVTKAHSENNVGQSNTQTLAHDVVHETAAHNITTEYGDQKVTVTEDTSGNIGVTTSATMATEELQLRRNNIIDYIMEGFIKDYLFLADVV